MKRKITMGLALASVLACSGARAETCKIESTRPHGDWTFVKVFDADTGTVVLQKAIIGGASNEVTVSGTRVRVDSKLAGGKHYKPGAVATCKGGNSVKI